MAFALSLKRGEVWRFLFGVLLVGFVYLWHVEAPVLWGDEAGTAVFSKNVIRAGVPVGFDGRNLAVFGNCASVSPNLLSRKIPWVQYYIGSLSMKLFGQDTMGVRLLFVLIGICSFFPLYAVLKKQSNHPAAMTALILLTPQVVLFQRNARYYPIVIFLFLLLLWTYTHQFHSQKVRLVLCCIFSILFFHTHQLAAFCTLSSFVLFGLIKDRSSLKIYLPAFLTGFGSWVVFYFCLKSVPDNGPDHIQMILESPAKWILVFLTGLKASVLDLDYVNVLPLLAWGLLLILVFFKKERKAMLEAFKSPIVLLIVLGLGIQIILNSALVGFETVHQYSLLRYMPHLIVAILIPLYLVLEGVVHQSVRRRFLKVCFVPFLLMAVAFSNLFTFSYWFPALSKRSPEFSWWPPVYAEILEQRPDSFNTLIETIAEGMGDNEQTILAWPPYVNEILNFYVGDKYLIIPSVLSGSPCEKAIIRKIERVSYERFKRQPKWVILFFRPLKRTPPGYERIKIPFFRKEPDATRPELIRRGFQEQSEGASTYIYVYKKL